MRVCFSVLPGEGFKLSPHFGESERFVIFDAAAQDFLPHARDTSLCRGPCRCFMPATLESGFDVVICRRIGHRVLRTLRACGVAVFLTQEPDAVTALAAFQAQKLAQVVRSTCLTGRRTATRKPAITKET